MTAVEIECPVKGMWSFMNPPGHHPDAKDFVAVDASGKPYKLSGFVRHVFWRLNVADVFAWEKKVFAPFDGVIVEAVNSCEDREKLNIFRDVIYTLVLAPRQKPNDATFFLGNHVIMQSDKGIYALFAHLRKDSIAIQQGERVKAGEAIAAIGNSGNTIQPHLHFQLTKDSDPFTAIPLPFVFAGFDKKEGRSWKREQLALPRNGQVFRTIEPV